MNDTVNMKIKKNLKKVKNIAKKVNKLANALGHADLTGSAGAKVGRSIGKRFGNGDAGASVGRFIGSALGRGDYVVSANSLGRSSRNLGAQVPRFGSNDESTIIEHREYIGDLVSSATPGLFQIKKYTFNPANSELFPWLSTIARNYEQYEPLGAIVAFKSTSSDFNATGQALGTVIIASDYDVYDANYSNKVEMENSTFAVSCKSSESMLHPIECDPKLRATKLLYNGDPQTASDGRFHNLCNIQVATVGISAASVNLGELWITYRIRLHKPQINTLDNRNLYINYGTCDNNSPTAFWGGVITLHPDYTNNLVDKVTFSTAAAGVGAITFVDASTWNRCYMIIMRVNVVSGGGTAYTLTPTSYDGQVHIKTVFTPQNLTGAGNNVVAAAVVKITRNTVVTTQPQIRFTMSYTLVDVISSVDVLIVEIVEDVFSI